MIAPTTPARHPWTFFRAGGLDQVELASAADLAALRQLDPKLWIALACPTRGLEFDQRTLELIDTDRDGRIRIPELLAAVEWSLARLKNPASLARGDAPLALADLATDTAEGRALLAAARRILEAAGRPEDTALGVHDLIDTATIFARTRFNGDGVVPAAVAGDPATQQAIADIIATLGSKPDRSGQPGVDTALAETFFADLQRLADWWSTADLPPPSHGSILFLGDRTIEAFAALQTVRAKIDDFFNRCRLAAFDSRAAEHLNPPAAELAALSTKDLSTLGAGVTALPLAAIGPGFRLPLADGLNPAWIRPMANFRQQVVAPVLGPVLASLTEEQWHELIARFEAHAAWHAAKPTTPAAQLSPDRIRELLRSSARQEIAQLIARDSAVAPEVDSLATIERLVRYHRDLARLLANFVNFADFYDPARPAVFQAGTLYLDSRHCDLCVPVADPATHATLASLSKCYIAYCDLKRPGETLKIAAVFANGDSDYLMVGRNGLFVDRRGRDWDATIVKVVDNPISIRQAFWSPYKKFVRMIEEQVAKRAAAAEAESDTRLAGAAATTVQIDKSQPPKRSEPKKFDLALITGIGVAIGSIGTMLAAIFARVLDLAWWQYPFLLVGLMLVISLPSMLIAWLKLRQRTLGPILEANGWAINGRVKINIPLGTSFTTLAKLPPGARLRTADPFEDKSAARTRHRVIVLLILGSLLGITIWALLDRQHHGGKFFWKERLAPSAAPAAPAPAPAGTAAPPAP